MLKQTIASFSVPGGMLVVGGEDSEAKARNEIFHHKMGRQGALDRELKRTER